MISLIIYLINIMYKYHIIWLIISTVYLSFLLSPWESKATNVFSSPSSQLAIFWHQVAEGVAQISVNGGGLRHGEVAMLRTSWDSWIQLKILILIHITEEMKKANVCQGTMWLAVKRSLYIWTMMLTAGCLQQLSSKPQNSQHWERFQFPGRAKNIYKKYRRDAASISL